MNENFLDFLANQKKSICLAEEHKLLLDLSFQLRSIIHILSLVVPHWPKLRSIIASLTKLWEVCTKLQLIGHILREKFPACMCFGFASRSKESFG
jgi:hypothetical protein